MFSGISENSICGDRGQLSGEKSNGQWPSGNGARYGGATLCN